MSVKIYTRMCANTLDWKQPSGKEQKSLSKESYERDFGFGFEEWNFSDRHKIGDWKYIYLEGMRFFNPKSASKYSGLDIVLYTRRRIKGIGHIEVLGEIKGTEWEFVNRESCNQILSTNPSFEQQILQDIRESTLNYSVNLERRLKAYENQYNGISISKAEFKSEPSIFNLRIKGISPQSTLVKNEPEDPYHFLYDLKRYQLNLME